MSTVRAALCCALSLAWSASAVAAPDPVEIRLDRCRLRWSVTEGLTVHCDDRLLLGGSTSPVVAYGPGWAWSHLAWSPEQLTAFVSAEGGRQTLTVRCEDPKLPWQQTVTAGPGDRFRIAFEFTRVAWDGAVNYEVCLGTPAVTWFAGARFEAVGPGGPAAGEIPLVYGTQHPIPESTRIVLHNVLGRVEFEASLPILFYDYPHRASFWLGRDGALPREQTQRWHADVSVGQALVEAGGLRVADVRIPDRASDERATVSFTVTRLGGAAEPVRAALVLDGGGSPGREESGVPAGEGPVPVRLALQLPGPGTHRVRLEVTAGGAPVYTSAPVAVVVPRVLTLRPGLIPFQEGDPGAFLVELSEDVPDELTLVVEQGGQTLYQGPAPAGRSAEISVPLERLPLGRSEVTGALVRGSSRAATARCEVYRLERKACAVAVHTRSRSLRVGGLPFCPQGCYADAGCVQQVIDEEAAAGVNVVAPYLPGGLEERRRGRSELRKLFDRCAQAGVYLHFDIRTASKPPHTDEKWQWLAEEIAEFRDHPALLAYYLADEPELGWASPADTALAYRKIKELDPWHPVTMVFCKAAAAAQYAEGMDIVMTDPYPIPNQPVTAVAEFCRTIRRDTGDALPLWIVPQAFGGGEWWQREPSRQEERVMTYLALIHGATGVQYFIRRPRISKPNSPDLWNECRRLLLEVSQLTPALCSPEGAPAVSASAPDVHLAAFRERGSVTVLAANPAPRPLPVEFRLGAAVRGEAQVLFENRVLPVDGGVWSDFIDAVGTRAYRIELEPPPAGPAVIDPRNVVVNPSFEEAHNTGTPDGCYISVQDQLSSWFVDPRTAVHGRQSLRLCTASEGRGVRVAPFPVPLSAGRRYRLSVWARGMREGLRFRLELDAIAGDAAVHEVGTEWREYAVEFTATPQAGARSQAALTLLSAGTAWFDALQVHPVP